MLFIPFLVNLLKKTFLEISLKVSGEQRELFLSFMTGLGFNGFQETDAFLHCYIDKDNWLIAKEEQIKEYLRINFPTVQIDRLFSMREIVEENWNEQWEQSIQPIEVGERLVVVPTWVEYVNKSGRLVLYIDPKMSFGTGHHETTRLTLKLLEQYITSGDNMLDVGTGSGILAIAAAKMGAVHATGIDIDPWSIDNARENISLNHVDKSVEILLGQPADIKNRVYNIITSNLTLNANIGFLKEYCRLLTERGTLLLSGFLKVDASEIKKHLEENGFLIIKVMTENEWSAIGALKVE